MDILATLSAIFTSPWFYGILLALAIVSYGTIRGVFKKLPFVNNKRNLIIVTAIGLLATSGMLGSIGFGSLGTGSLASANWNVIDVKATGLTTGIGGTIAVDSSNPYLVNLRATDAQLNETSGYYEVNQSTFTVTRSGKLDADSCTVRVSSGDYYINERTGVNSATPYNIVEKDVTGKLKAYLKSGSQATTSDYQESMPLAFSEGSASSTFTLLLEADEESHDALNQYNSKDVIVDVCGQPITVKVYRMD